MKSSAWKYNIRLRGGPCDGHTICDLIAEIRIPNYVETNDVEAPGFKVFTYKQGANLHRIPKESL